MRGTKRKGGREKGRGERGQGRERKRETTKRARHNIAKGDDALLPAFARPGSERRPSGLRQDGCQIRGERCRLAARGRTVRRSRQQRRWRAILFSAQRATCSVRRGQPVR
eukprot:578113-Pleurochrysis_carterae.AAC.1